MTTPQSEFAALLAKGGLPVFPCEVNGKLPAIKNYPERATTDPTQVAVWWNGKPKNVAVSTGHLGDGGILTVVDVDVKDGKKGDVTLLQLEAEGFEFPPTFEVRTPSNGRHLYYRAPIALRQGVNTLGQGIDTRCVGGYVLAPGSVIDGRKYEVVNKSHIAPAPAWLVEKLCGVKERAEIKTEYLEGIEPDRAFQRAQQWLLTAPLAIEGQGGDAGTYKVVLHLKDLGCDADQALALLAPWNERCLPPWSQEDLETKVRNAFRYGRDPQGIAAPEAIFPPIEETVPEPPKDHPFGKFNERFAFVFSGGTGNILWET